jgi:hypothetical protein
MKSPATFKPAVPHPAIFAWARLLGKVTVCGQPDFNGRKGER